MKKIMILNGRRMTTKENAHSYMAHKLGFPSWYGGNLDALADCLGGFGDRTSVILVNAGSLKKELGGYGESIIQVFREVSAPENAFNFICIDE